MKFVFARRKASPGSTAKCSQALLSGVKIKSLVQSWLAGTVGVTRWLEEKGISRQLQQSYVKTGWLESIGHGAFKRTGDTVDWLGGLYAVQKQLGLAVHIGGRTALGMQGQAHYLELSQKTASLFAPHAVTLPAWFRNSDWNITLNTHHTAFLPSDMGLVEIESKLFSVRASGSARTLMECLYLAPKEFDLVEAFQLMEGLNALRPNTVQQLLENCRSVKVKRLFLFLAERAGHGWVKHLDLTRIGTGQGTRSLAKGGAYIAKYQMMVPQELARL